MTIPSWMYSTPSRQKPRSGSRPYRWRHLCYADVFSDTGLISLASLFCGGHIVWSTLWKRIFPVVSSFIFSIWISSQIEIHLIRSTLKSFTSSWPSASSVLEAETFEINRFSPKAPPLHLKLLRVSLFRFRILFSGSVVFWIFLRRKKHLKGKVTSSIIFDCSCDTSSDVDQYCGASSLCHRNGRPPIVLHSLRILCCP